MFQVLQHCAVRENRLLFDVKESAAAAAAAQAQAQSIINAALPIAHASRNWQFKKSKKRKK